MGKDTMSHKRFLLLDDDPLFASLLIKLGSQEGIVVEHVMSVRELDPTFHFEAFDLAIIDYYLGYSDGVQESQSLDGLIGSIPKMLISQSALEDLHVPLRSAEFQAFQVKSSGCEDILRAALGLLHK